MPILHENTLDDTAKICIRDTAGVIRGRVDPSTGEFHASRSVLRHTPPGIAFDVTVLERALQAGATSLVVTCRGETFRAPMVTMWRHGRVSDVGAGPQWFLSMRFWNRPEPAPQPAPQPVPQMAFFFR